MSQCPWYAKVTAGEPVADLGQHCRPATGKGGPPSLVVKMTPRTPEASTVVKPTVPPGGPGLFHMKGRHLPPYIEHVWHHLAAKYGRKRAYAMAVGIVKKWAAGINPGGKHPTHTHADVRAAAVMNVAEWEKDKADAHRQSAAHRKGRSGHTLAAAAEPAGGMLPQFGLYQRPSQTVSPSPPLPPAVKLPTAGEVLTLAGKVPESADVTLSNSARTFLQAAATKLEKDDRQEALHALRSAQTALAAAHRADVPTVVGGYTAPVPPAVMGSVNPVLLQARRKAEQWRKLEHETAVLIDRMRKLYFHGQLNSQVAQARLAGESAVDKVLRLAGKS
jgi:hypothetical protein